LANTAAAMSSQRPDTITLQLRFLKDNIVVDDDLTTTDRERPESTGGVLPLADYLVIGAVKSALLVTFGNYFEVDSFCDTTQITPRLSINE
jgi:hypothetical protein